MLITHWYTNQDLQCHAMMLWNTVSTHLNVPKTRKKYQIMYKILNARTVACKKERSQPQRIIVSWSLLLFSRYTSNLLWHWDVAKMKSVTTEDHFISENVQVVRPVCLKSLACWRIAMESFSWPTIYRKCCRLLIYLHSSQISSTTRFLDGFLLSCAIGILFIYPPPV